MVVLQEAFEFVHGFFDLMNGRQGNDTEVVWAYPVKTCTLDEQDFFTHEQVVDEFHVVMNAVHFGIDLGNIYIAPMGLTQETPGIWLISSHALLRCSNRRPPGRINSLML